MSAIVKELEREGFRVVGADELLGDADLPEGPLGRVRPDALALADIGRGMRIARAIGALDIGQAAVVQQGLVLGVEAIEGTDALLRRVAGVAPRRAGRRAGQGRETRARNARRPPDDRSANRALAAESGLRGIAAQAGATIVLDRPETVRRADEAGLFVVGVRPE